MKTKLLTVAACWIMTMASLGTAVASDCPGLCAECRSLALSICGGNCVANFACSLSQCSCGFSCKPNCTKSPVALVLRDPLKPQLASLKISPKQSPANVRFVIVNQPEVPIVMADFEVGNDAGRQVSELTYTLRNESGFSLKEVRITLAFFNELNEPLGGEVVTETLNLETQESRHLHVSLKHYVDSGERVSVAFTSYRTDTQSWHADNEAVAKAMKQQ